MSAHWLSEIQLRELLGPTDAAALLGALGGLQFYMPHDPRRTGILGRDLSEIVSRASLRKLGDLYGGDEVKLPNARRNTARDEVFRRLRAGVSIRAVADGLRLSQRYVERLAAEERRAAAAALALREERFRQLSLLE